jgi:cell division protein FtsB
MAVVGYFGAYAIWGNRGILELEDTQAKLGIQRERLAELQANRARLEHRIVLMTENPESRPDRGAGADAADGRRAEPGRGTSQQKLISSL